MVWLNRRAPENIRRILVTFDVFQEPISWLNSYASENIYSMLVTFETSHLEISSLNTLALSNSKRMLVIRVVTILSNGIIKPVPSVKEVVFLAYALILVIESGESRITA